jgi:hypothetical protein
MHILFLSDNFPPEVNAPASRTFEHCREWAKAGHRVTVITCVPNFPKGEVYPGYRNKPWQSETLEGVRVVRVWSYIAANAGFGRRILDYQSFMVAATLASLAVGKVDVVVGTSPQFFTVCAAYVVSRLKHVPFVFELRDLWPESIEAVGAMGGGFGLRLLRRLAFFLYRQAALVVSVTHSFRYALAREGIDPRKIAVVTNGVDLGRFQAQAKNPKLVETLGLQGQFVVGYIGTHGLAHGLETLLQAADVLRQEPGGEVFRFILLGDGARKAALQAQARRMGLDNVLFLNSVAKEDVVDYWSLLDVSIIHLKKSEVFTTVIPSKLFESMGMGIPIALGVAGEAAELVEREAVGLLFEPENADQLCERLRTLRDQPTLRHSLRDNALAAAQRYDRSALARRMLALLERLVSPPAA